MTPTTYQTALEEVSQIVKGLLLGHALQPERYQIARKKWQDIQQNPQAHWMESQVLMNLVNSQSLTKTHLGMLKHLPESEEISESTLKILIGISQHIERERSKARARIGR